MTKRHLYLIDPDSEIDSWQTELEKKVEKRMDIFARCCLGAWTIWAIVEFLK